MLANIAKDNSRKAFFVFRTLDSGLSTLLPLSVLFVFRDQNLYAFIEMIIGTALISSNFLDAGFFFYVYYAYKEAQDKSIFFKEYYSGGIFFIVIYLVLMLFAISVEPGKTSLIFCFISRALYLYAYRIFASYGALLNRQNIVSKFSIAVSIISFILVLFGEHYKISKKEYLFFLPNMFAVFLILFVYLFQNGIKRIFNFKPYFIPSLKFSWSIVLNYSMLSLFSNFAKIYLYAKTSYNAMTIFSLMQRLSSIIRLFHVSLASYYTKELILAPLSKVKAYFMEYVVMMSLGACVTLFSSYSVFYFIGKKLPFDLLSVIFMATLLSCFCSYLEMLFNRAGKPAYLLLINIFSLLVYFTYLSVSKLNITNFSVAMLIASVTTFCIIVILLNRIKKTLR